MEIIQYGCGYEKCVNNPHRWTLTQLNKNHPEWKLLVWPWAPWIKSLRPGYADNAGNKDVYFIFKKNRIWFIRLAKSVLHLPEDPKRGVGVAEYEGQQLYQFGLCLVFNIYFKKKVLGLVGIWIRKVTCWLRWKWVLINRLPWTQYC